MAADGVGRNVRTFLHLLRIHRLSSSAKEAGGDEVAEAGRHRRGRSTWTSVATASLDGRRRRNAALGRLKVFVVLRRRGRRRDSDDVVASETVSVRAWSRCRSRRARPPRLDPILLVAKHRRTRRRSTMQRHLPDFLCAHRSAESAFIGVGRRRTEPITLVGLDGEEDAVGQPAATGAGAVEPPAEEGHEREEEEDADDDDGDEPGLALGRRRRR